MLAFIALVRALIQYGPLLVQLVHFIALEVDEEKRRASVTAIRNGLATATQTKDTSQLETAIRNHCVPSTGCKL